MELTNLVLRLEELGCDVLVEGSLISVQRPITALIETQNLLELVRSIYAPAYSGIYRVNFGLETVTFVYIG